MTTIQTKKYAKLKFIGLGIGVTSTLIQPYLFNKFFAQDDFAFLLLLYGFTTYLMFFDFGISKPIYAVLRKKFISNDEVGYILKDIIPFYNMVVVVLAIIFGICVYLASNSFPNSFNITVLVFFILITSMTIGINYLENILNAIDEQIFFQKIDLARKSSNLLFPFLLFIDNTFTLSLLMNSIVILILYILVQYKLKNYYESSFNLFLNSIADFILIIKQYGKSSAQYLLFAINETIVYNGGFILIPIFLSSLFIVQYALWMKIFMGILMFVKTVIDIFIHKITRFYHEKDFDNVYKYLTITFLLSIVVSIFFTVSIYYFNDLLFKYWVDEKYSFSGLYYLALFMWLVGVSIQGVSGTFLLSEGTSFGIMSKVSSAIVLVLVITQFIALYTFKNLEEFLLLGSFVYFLGAFVYLKMLVNLLSNTKKRENCENI